MTHHSVARILVRLITTKTVLVAMVGLLLQFSSLQFSVLQSLRAEQRPNVVVLLADDLGYTGLRCFGSDLHETPNLDRLAAEGMKFTSAYAACTVCSPTRASLMTGKYPARLHLTDFIAGQNRPFAKLKIPDWNKGLPLPEETIAESLKKVGYATGQVGKWHLEYKRTSDADKFSPRGHGFDVQAMKPPGTRGYFLPEQMIQRGEAKSGYLTDHLTDEAVKLIDQWKDRPFFLYFAYHTPHTPIQGKPELVQHYQNRTSSQLRHQNPTYAAMVHSLDESVGRIMAQLVDSGIADRTIVMFISDNGGLTQKFGQATGFIDNAPLRRGKGSAYEGGVRVPMIVKWPGVTNRGSESDEPVATIDFFPTILEMTGAVDRAAGDARRAPRVDGISLVSLLRNPESKLDRDALFWHYPHYHAGGDSPYGAVRAGKWRLVEFYEQMQIELYNLEDDLGESTNLAAELPEKADQLRDMLHRWRKSVGAQMPSPNPNYDKSQETRVKSQGTR